MSVVIGSGALILGYAATAWFCVRKGMPRAQITKYAGIAAILALILAESVMSL